MRTCDVCKLPANDARLFDVVIVSVLKDSQLTSYNVSAVLDKLGIKHGITSKSAPSFGDVCTACQVGLEKELSKAIDAGISAIVESVLSIAKKTQNTVKGEAAKNAAAFAAASEDFREWRGQWGQRR
mgnify:CR=1 FL=1